MQRGKLSSKLTSNIIAPTGSVSLLGDGWRCIHRESWADNHHVFFAKNVFFYQNTISTLGAQRSRLSKQVNASPTNDFWIIECGKPTSPLGCAALQIFPGRFRHGLLFLDIGSACHTLSDELVSQLITLAMINHELAGLEIISLTPATTEHLHFLGGMKRKSLMSFSKSLAPTPTTQEIYHLEPDEWFESKHGEKSCKSLNWLKKRKEREKASRSATVRAKRKAPFLFNLLTLGRRRNA